MEKSAQRGVIVPVAQAITAVGGYLMSTFASQFPDWFQAAAAGVGLFMGVAGVAGLVLYGFARAFPGNELLQRLAFMPKPARYDTKMSEAVAYVATRKWGQEFDALFLSNAPAAAHAMQEMRTAAHEGEIAVWGRISHNGVHVPIGPDYWRYWQIEWISTVNGESSTEPAEIGQTNAQAYFDLMVSKAQVKARWA